MLPLFVLAHFAHHLVTALPIPLLPFIRDEFNLDYTRSSLVVTSFVLAYGIGQLPAGWLADRIGPRIPITIGICGVAVVGVLVGISHTYIMMLGFLVIMGLVGGGYHPSAAPMISKSVEPRKRGRALGIHAIGGSGSYFLVPIAAAAIAATRGWRGAFIGLAIPTAVFGIIFYMLLGRRAGTSQVKQVTIDHRDETPAAPDNMRRLVAFMILTVITDGVIMAIITFIPLYVVDYFGVSKEAGASFLAIFFATGIWAGPLGGYLSDRLRKVILLIATSLMAGLIIYLLNLAPYGLGIGALLLIMGMAMYIRMPVSESYIMGHTIERHRSTIYGIYYFSIQEVGALFAPALGYLIDNFGFHTAFTVTSAAAIVVTVVCSVFLWGSWD